MILFAAVVAAAAADDVDDASELSQLASSCVMLRLLHSHFFARRCQLIG